MSELKIVDPTSQDGQWRRWRMGELHHHSESIADSEERRRQAQQRRSREHRIELETARKEILERAREEGYREGLQAGREAGYAEGLAQGFEQGREAARSEVQAALAPMKELVQTFHDALQELNDSVVDEMVELAMETGRQLAGEALKSRPRQVANLVRKLLHEEPLMTGQPRLWLHPEDLQLVAEELGEELEAALWSLHPDDQLQRGGCRVTSASGELDATGQTRWQAAISRVRRPRSRRSVSGEIRSLE